MKGATRYDCFLYQLTLHEQFPVYPQIRPGYRIKYLKKPLIEALCNVCDF